MQTLGTTSAKDIQAANLNPSNVEKTTSAERRRIPMNQSVQRFEVDPIPGYHLHWFLNNSARVARAIQGGYEFVNDEEVTVNGVALGTAEDAGNMDLGSRVSIPSGGINRDGQAEMHVLMKIKEEHYQESEAIREERNESVASALRGGTVEDFGLGRGGDASNRYLDRARTKLPDLFTPKRR